MCMIKLLNGQCEPSAVISFHNVFYPVNAFILSIFGYVVQNNKEYAYGIIDCHKILTDSNETSI